ncbi:kinase-like domain-containing protein [Mycena rebaudengoi]|nr:kinase-like domain-containing protein [Mycena rebaudengoi]
MGLRKLFRSRQTTRPPSSPVAAECLDSARKAQDTNSELQRAQGSKPAGSETYSVVPPSEQLMGKAPSTIEYRLLGTGAFATVWGYFCPRTNNYLAAKVVLDRRIDPYHMDAEIAALQRIAAHPHPNLLSLVRGSIRLHEYSVAIITNYHPTTLLCMLGILPRPHQCTVLYATLCREIADGLRHLHGLGIIHKDIKPGNILISQDGHCVIADYNASHLSNDVHLYKSRLGHVNDVRTFPYVSPEALYAGVGGFATFDERSDYWSLGMTLYDLIIKFSESLPEGPYTHADLGLDGGAQMVGSLTFAGPPRDVTELVLSLCQIHPADRLYGDRLEHRLVSLGAGGILGRAAPFQITWYPCAGEPLCTWNSDIGTEPRLGRSPPMLAHRLSRQSAIMPSLFEPAPPPVSGVATLDSRSHSIFDPFQSNSALAQDLSETAAAAEEQDAPSTV